MNLSFQNKLKENLRKYPNNIALEYGEERLTFLQLDQKTDWIASRIIAAGVKKSRFIGIYTDDKSRFILAMIGILKAGCVFVPLEPMIPWKRTETMLRTTNTCIVFTDGQYQQQFDVLCRTFIIDESCFRIEASLATETQVEYDPEGPVYVYFTSGSTGTPKAILGKSKSLLHFIEWEIDTFCINESFRVSQLTNPLFDVLLRDVFVPLFSGGCVCIPGNREILVNRDELVNWIDDSRVHLIHCVPAVFRVFNAENLTPENFRQLKYILMSGERIPPYDLSKWYAVFDERIQLVNLYGPTETTMIKTYYFIQKNDVQKSRIPVGKPMRGCRIIILDKNMTPCGKEIVGEIYIRTPYMTLGYYNEEELNKKYFIPNPFNNDPNDLFYKTGDLGKILPDGNIDLIGRSDRQVKIRGIRVELEEIENVILKSTLVQEVVIVDIEHHDQEIHLCAYYVAKTGLDIANLKDHLAMELPDYMIPQYFVQLESIPRTSSGKVDIKSLPMPEIIIEEGEYLPPRDEIEEKLVKIFSEILKVDEKNIGIQQSFFKLGGHSLKVTVLTSLIHKIFNVKVPVAKIFNTPGICDLATFIRQSRQDDFQSLVPVVKKDNYPLSSAQKRLYLIHQGSPNSIAYNMPAIYIIEKTAPHLLEDAFRKLICRHESLRTSIEIIDGALRQKIHDEVNFTFEYHDLSNNNETDALKQENLIIKNFVSPFDLSRPPLLRAGLIKTSEDRFIFLADIHHIICDGVSQNIMIKEFLALYSGIELPPLALHYKDFAYWQNQLLESGQLQKQANFWLKEFEELPFELNLPIDFERTEKRSYDGDKLYFEIGPKETEQLNKIVVLEDATLFMGLLSIYNILLSRVSGQEDIVIGTGIAGRRHADLQNIIGMFVNTLALRNRPEGRKSFITFLREVRQKTLLAYENQDFQFEELVEKIVKEKNNNRNPLFDAAIMMQNVQLETEVPEIEGNLLKIKPYGYQKMMSKFDIVLICLEADNKLVLSFDYCVKLFKPETIKMLISHFKEIVAAVVANKHIHLDQIVLSNDLVSMSPGTFQKEQGDFVF